MYMKIIVSTFLFLFSFVNGYSDSPIVKNPPYPIAETPQLPLEVYTEEFAMILGTKPQLVHLAEGFGFTEGPVYLSIQNSEEGYLLFTDQINDNIMILRWHGIL